MLRQKESLSTQVASLLSERIRSGEYAPGARIPTESRLCDEFGVSRTVVREAIASLRADGLLRSRQGIGVFVSERPRAGSFQISEEEVRSLSESIELLELRLSVEVESAGLAAERRTAEELAVIEDLMNRIDAMRDQPDSIPVHYDFDMHIAIARATHNEHFHRFLEFLGPMIVPRSRLGALVRKEEADRYYRRIHAEHRKVVAAIAEQNPERARAAMRRHLENSLARFRKVVEASRREGAAEATAEPEARRRAAALASGTLGRSRES